MKIRLFIMIVLIAGLTTSVMAKEKKEWKEYKKRHFVVYYKDAPRDFVETVEKSAEQYYREIARNLGFTRYKGWTWDERASIYIFDDSDDYVVTGKYANWSHGVASPKQKIIRTYPTAHGFFDSTLPHELGHIIFREFVGYKARVPGWFEEGIAMYQEKAKRFGSHKVVKDAMKNEQFIPLQELSHIRLTSKSSPELVHLFYAESASAVSFMINEHGQHRFVQFCRKLEEGKPFDWALDSIYVRFKNTEALNKAWMRYLKK